MYLSVCLCVLAGSVLQDHFLQLNTLGSNWTFTKLCRWCIVLEVFSFSGLILPFIFYYDIHFTPHTHKFQHTTRILLAVHDTHESCICIPCTTAYTEIKALLFFCSLPWMSHWRNQRNKLKLDHLTLGSPPLEDMRHRTLRHQRSSDNMINVPMNSFHVPNVRIDQRKTSSAEDMMARKNSTGNLYAIEKTLDFPSPIC